MRKSSLALVLVLACMAGATITLWPASAEAGACGCGIRCINAGNPNDECDHNHLGAGCAIHEGWKCVDV